MTENESQGPWLGSLKAREWFLLYARPELVLPFAFAAGSITMMV